MDIKSLFTMFKSPSDKRKILHITCAVVAFFLISNKSPDCVLTSFLPFPEVKLSFTVQRSKLMQSDLCRTSVLTLTCLYRV